MVVCFKNKNGAKGIDLTITPGLYAVKGTSNREAGFAMGMVLAGSVKRFNIITFIGHFEPLKGTTRQYTFGDTLDVSHKVKGRLEAGVSFSFFLTEDAWNPQVGPLIVLSDKKGQTKFSFRAGRASEFRVARTFSF